MNASSGNAATYVLLLRTNLLRIKLKSKSDEKKHECTKSRVNDLYLTFFFESQTRGGGVSKIEENIIRDREPI